MGFLPPAIEGH